ncbi:hypothetical protein CEXT_749891 [Caerostris extrusa]|uniref:Uncharacterized protein n=1 Tax=Caerostris extrusa TaxID=172846 RepID=A0AAV4XQL2_CAEEX|nr:hypothetical protein CEXT_749891 [Caerostris extrusa]
MECKKFAFGAHLYCGSQRRHAEILKDFKKNEMAIGLDVWQFFFSFERTFVQMFLPKIGKMRLYCSGRCGGHYGLTIDCVQVALTSRRVGEKRRISFEWTEQLVSSLANSRINYIGIRESVAPHQ